MKELERAFLAFVWLWICAVGVSGVRAAPPTVGDIPPLHFEPPRPERTTLENGVVVYLLEDHELPLVNVNLRIRINSADEPASRPRILDFLGSVWRTGGTEKRSPERLNKELEYMAARVETSASLEQLSISLSCLTKDLDKGLDIFQDVLFHPLFRKKQLLLEKDSRLESLRRKNDALSNIARRAFRDILYGKKHPYSLNHTPASIQKITRKDLRQLHKKLVVPDGAMLVLSGDFSRDQMVSSLNKMFENWKPTGRVLPQENLFERDNLPGRVFYVEKDVNQSRVLMGKIGISRHDPRHFSMEIANAILGGGGTSRLFAHIRSRLGLAYVVGSFATEPKGPGLLGVGCQTKAESTPEVIRAIFAELDKFSSEPPTPAELDLAKDTITHSFIFKFDSPASVVSERANLEFYGYPRDYWETYIDKIKAVSANDVLGTARKYFSREKFKLLVVGDKTKFGEPLEQWGKVVEIPLADIE